MLFLSFSAEWGTAFGLWQNDLQRCSAVFSELTHGC